MSIVYRPNAHRHNPPRGDRWRYPRGTLWRCDECGIYMVSDGNDAWSPPFPFGPTARRIKRIEAGR